MDERDERRDPPPQTDAQDGRDGEEPGPPGVAQPAVSASHGPEPTGETSPLRVRYTRKRILVLGAAFTAGLVAVLTVFRRVGSSSLSSAAGPLSTVFSSFPVRSVEPVPHKTLDEWTVVVDGLVEAPQRIDATTWRSLARSTETVTFHCVEGWSVDDVKWAGVRPMVLLERARLKPEAGWVNFHAFGGGYNDSIPLSLVRETSTLLADSLNDEPLPAAHGGPLRLVVPDQLGYKSVKWVTRLEVTDQPVRGYWERFGYPMDAPVKG